MDHSSYIKTVSSYRLPRIPQEGWIDVTYRCNNNCIHCWLRIDAQSPEKENEITFSQIQNFAEQARMEGCRSWSISGGEPMLRPDFKDIFEYLTSQVPHYSLNSNGTLITPSIAKLLRLRGVKMIALYGADAVVHDRVTRNPGSFDACMRGMSYLKESNAGFTVQIIPMRDNYHQLQKMIDLAGTLSPSYRIGASWLYLSADLDEEKNSEILNQRLTPEEVIVVDPARPTLDDYVFNKNNNKRKTAGVCSSDGMLSGCLKGGKQFHIDPYGFLTNCSTMKDPVLRYDLKKDSFKQIWEEKISSYAPCVEHEREYEENCMHCDNQQFCSWCPAYAYLEKGRLSAPVSYLCDIADMRKEYMKKWKANNYQMFELADMTVHVDSDIELPKTTFSDRFKTFRSQKQREEHLYISHHYSLPDLNILQSAECIYNNKPWAVYRLGSSYIYLCLGSKTDHYKPNAVAVFSEDHCRVQIYHSSEQLIRTGGLGALTGFSSDQIMISHLLALKKGCYFHSAGLIINGKGILFLGHSGAGKSTIVKKLKHFGLVLSDDRNIVRSWPRGYRLHGTWSHGEVPLVANRSAPLDALIFIQQDSDNEIHIIDDKREVFHQLLKRVIKPFVTKNWWENTIDLLDDISGSVSGYTLSFTKGDGLLNEIENIVGPLVPGQADQILEEMSQKSTSIDE